MPERSRETRSNHAVSVRSGARGGPNVTGRALSGGPEHARAPGGDGRFPPASRRAGSLCPGPGRGWALSGKLVRNVPESARIRRNRAKTVRFRHRMDQPAMSVSLCERTTTRGVRGVLHAKSRSDRKTGPVGWDAWAVLQAKLSFQSDTTLCKCYNTCKVWYRCKSGGSAVKTDLGRIARQGCPARSADALGATRPHAAHGGTSPPEPMPWTASSHMPRTRRRIFQTAIATAAAGSTGHGPLGEAAPHLAKTTVLVPFMRTRCSAWKRTAWARTRRSTSWPRATMSAVESAWLTRVTSCSMMGPSSRSAVT